MDRALRIWHRGWLRRAISVFSFGYYPLTDVASVYIVTADVECRLNALIDSTVSFAVDAGAELRSIMTDDVDARLLATAKSVGIRIDTGVVDVGL